MEYKCARCAHCCSSGGTCDLLRLGLRLELLRRGHVGRLPVEDDFGLFEVAARVCKGWVRSVVARW